MLPTGIDVLTKVAASTAHHTAKGNAAAAKPASTGSGYLHVAVIDREGVEVLHTEVEHVGRFVDEQVLEKVGQQSAQVRVMCRVTGVNGTKLFLSQYQATTPLRHQSITQLLNRE